tara:strand:- start:170 stop:1147 length:978 start_codon:yes stop_codon:yes gene_type:complete
MNNDKKMSSLEVYIDSLIREDRSLIGLDSVISAIALGARRVNTEVQKAALGDSLGVTGDKNVHGEIVQRLDEAGSNIFVDTLRNSARVAAIGCEEIEGVEVVGDGDGHNYVVQMDPVDGSSNIDVAVTIGSIFGIWRRSGDDPVTESILLRPGNEQIAAVYVVYGSSTVMIVATKGCVNGFTLDVDKGQFILTHQDVKIPVKCEYYSLNVGNYSRFDKSTQKAVDKLRDEYSLRYVGSLVADFHRNLLKGGIFLYTGDIKNPEGKLRLMYEANPLAFVAEQAGGAGYSNAQRILDIQPYARHQRTPLILGNKLEVDLVVQTINGN